MPINSDKPKRWKKDIAASVDLFNKWFMQFAPTVFRESRLATTLEIEETLQCTKDLTALDIEMLKVSPRAIRTLRMCCCPPLARDRLIGLAGVSKNLVGRLEKGIVPRADAGDSDLQRVVDKVSHMLDRDIFPWIEERRFATPEERLRAATIVADRLCGAVSDPIVRNAQEKRQLVAIETYLDAKQYTRKPHPTSEPLKAMEPGTYAIRMNVIVGKSQKVNIPVDMVIQPKKLRRGSLPTLIEAKSAGDFTNVNKRRKEEAAKMHQLRAAYGAGVQYVLFLCGYFDSGYLGYEAAEGIDWIWEHRMTDLDKLGL